jgi:hypothetical protein
MAQLGSCCATAAERLGCISEREGVQQGHRSVEWLLDVRAARHREVYLSELFQGRLVRLHQANSDPEKYDERSIQQPLERVHPTPPLLLPQALHGVHICGRFVGLGDQPTCIVGTRHVATETWHDCVHFAPPCWCPLERFFLRKSSPAGFALRSYRPLAFEAALFGFQITHRKGRVATLRLGWHLDRNRWTPSSGWRGNHHRMTPAPDQALSCAVMLKLIPRRESHQCADDGERAGVTRHDVYQEVWCFAVHHIAPVLGAAPTARAETRSQEGSFCITLSYDR